MVNRKAALWSHFEIISILRAIFVQSFFLFFFFFFFLFLFKQLKRNEQLDLKDEICVCNNNRYLWNWRKGNMVLSFLFLCCFVLCRTFTKESRIQWLSRQVRALFSNSLGWRAYKDLWSLKKFKYYMFLLPKALECHFEFLTVTVAVSRVPPELSLIHIWRCRRWP